MKYSLGVDSVERAYEAAKAAYALFGVDSDAAIEAALAIPLSVHCWQGDDVAGFEGADGISSGGLLATGNYPGRARSGEELRADAEFAFARIPGVKRFNLHSLYAETGGRKVARDELEPEHFRRWMDWSAAKKIPLDFNPSFFAHPLSESGWTLSSADSSVRRFWIRHGISCRKIAAAFGKAQGSASVENIWVPDGSKDLPADRAAPRRRLKDALDEILASPYPGLVTDAVESKLFGIGSEAYVVGSHDFYLAYATQKQVYVCLDMGHFHPTESVADKISAVLQFVPGVLTHFSRGIRWDSDHVAIFSDELRDVCREIIRQNALPRIAVALDYFDASINRIAAWIIGGRAVRKALLEALLEPAALLREAESAGRLHERLALLEEAKTLPFGAVWDKCCLAASVPTGGAWLADVAGYEAGLSRS